MFLTPMKGKIEDTILRHLEEQLKGGTKLT
jgi:hypothetical protein